MRASLGLGRMGMGRDLKNGASRLVGVRCQVRRNGSDGAISGWGRFLELLKEGEERIERGKIGVRGVVFLGRFGK